jgi:hypothetical protein
VPQLSNHEGVECFDRCSALRLSSSAQFADATSCGGGFGFAIEPRGWVWVRRREGAAHTPSHLDVAAGGVRERQRAAGPFLQVVVRQHTHGSGEIVPAQQDGFALPRLERVVP